MSEKKTVTISLEKLEAIFEKCDVSPLKKKMMLARIKAENETPSNARAKPPFPSVYCLVNGITTSYKMPSPNAKREFKMINFFDDALPYEFKQETSIPHLVVVTTSLKAAILVFDMLLAQNGLKIRFLEFVILSGVAPSGELIKAPAPSQMKQKLEKTPLGIWNKDSSSIKINRVTVSIDDELKKHVSFVAESGSLRTVRGIDDEYRVTVTSSSRAPHESLREVDENDVHQGSELSFLSLYCLVNGVKTSYKMPPRSATREFKSISMFDDFLPYELKEKTSIPHVVVVTTNVKLASNVFDLLLSQNGLKIRFLEFMILTGVAKDGRLFRPKASLYEMEQELEGSALGIWGKGSPSTKIIRVTDSIDGELERHVAFVAESGSLRMIRGIDDEYRVSRPSSHAPRYTLSDLDQNRARQSLNSDNNIVPAGNNPAMEFARSFMRLFNSQQGSGNRSPTANRVDRSRSRSPHRRGESTENRDAALINRDRARGRHRADTHDNKRFDPVNPVTK